MKTLKKRYIEMRPAIEQRLKDFEQIPSEQYFEELAFCLCTPQSSARRADVAIKQLKAKGLLLNGSAKEVGQVLLSAGIRFHLVKAQRIVAARRIYLDLPEDSYAARDWLFQNVKGLGMKESGHFLRNIGRGGDLAILDRHILKNLKKYGAIDEVPNSMTRKKYLELEQRMQQFSRATEIPMTHLDILFWSSETEEIFK